MTTDFEAGGFKNTGFPIGLVKMESEWLEQLNWLREMSAGGSCD